MLNKNPASLDAMQKPKLGEPCNGCGHCCKTEACKLSVDFLKSTVTPCIALEHAYGRYWCGLVKNPSKHLGLQDWAQEFADIELAPKFAFVLRLGLGCDADD